MELTRENVLNTLGKITEPDLKNDLVSLNLIEYSFFVFANNLKN